VKIGLSAYLLHAGADYRSAGVSTYSYQLLTHLQGAAPDLEFKAFVGSDAPDIPLPEVRARVRTDNPALRILWEQTVLPLQLARDRVDIVHGTVNVIPWVHASRSVVTVHDLAFAVHPDKFRPARRLYLTAAVRISVARAGHIIAVSHHTRRALEDIWQVPKEKISVVYSGVDERFRPLSRDESNLGVADGRPFILHVGTLEPRKNIEVLIRAYARIRHTIPHVLVLIGARGWYYQNIFRLIAELGLQEEVLAPGYVDPGDLARWYNSADLLVYPSAYEGFGLPVLEAMACGVPVVISEAEALREVAGDAALSVAAEPDTLGGAIQKVLADQMLAGRMRVAGLERAGQFTWDRTARETAALYRRIADGE